MRQRFTQRLTRQVDILAVGAVIGPVAALIVVLVDAYVALSHPSASALFNGQIPWLLVAIPLILITGIFIGLRAGPGAALSVILIAIAAERFSQSLLPGGGINVRLDELVVPTITLGVLARAWAEGHLWQSLQRIPGLLLLGFFLLASLIPTMLIMTERVRGVSLFVILLAGALCYVGVAMLVGRLGHGRVEDLVTLLMVVGALEAAFGLVTLGLSIWQGEATPIGVQIEPVSRLFEAYGTMFEANFFGQYLAAIFLVAVAFLWQLASQRRLRSRFARVLAVAVVLAALGVLGSETRASWLGLVAGMVVVAVLLGISPAQERRPRSREQQVIARWLPSWALLVMMLPVVAVGLVLASAGTPLGQRLASVVDFTSGSGYGRLRILQLVLSDLRNPIIGVGVGSFNLALPVAPGAAPDAHPWIYSMFLAVLHDSGVVGLLLWFAFLAMIYYQLLRVVRSTAPQSVRTLAIGMSAALTCLLISAQATTNMYLIFFWVFLGLAGSLPLLAAQADSSADRHSQSRDVALAETDTLRLPAPGRMRAVRAAIFEQTDHDAKSNNLTTR